MHSRWYMKVAKPKNCDHHQDGKKNNQEWFFFCNHHIRLNLAKGQTMIEKCMAEQKKMKAKRIEFAIADEMRDDPFCCLFLFSPFHFKEYQKDAPNLIKWRDFVPL